MAQVAAPAFLNSKFVDLARRERAGVRTLHIIGALAALGLLGHLSLILWARHEFTPVESIVALHAHMLLHGGGLYYNLNRYPFTVSPYGPIFYALSGGLQLTGLPPFLAARLLSFLALGTSLWLCWRAAQSMTGDRYAPAAGVILAASTANILFWGTVGQVDILAACLSLAAFTLFLRARGHKDNASLIWAGVFAVLAVFTKETSLAAGAAIATTLLLEDRRRAAWWIPTVALAGLGIALGLNAITHGGYYANTILANLNPFTCFELAQQLRYLLLTSLGLILVAALGASRASRRTYPVYVYAAFAAIVFLSTAPKVGSDLNYQIELLLVLSVCAAAALGDLEFFPAVFASRRTWVTLLQMPLLLHVALNLVLTGRILILRGLMEPARREETAALKKYVERPGLLYSEHYDSLVQYRGHMDIEPLIYSLLLAAGHSDAGPVLRDLSQRKFTSLILIEDLAAPPASINKDSQFPGIPPAQLDAMRMNYTLVERVPGPYNLYVYEPKRD